MSDSKSAGAPAGASGGAAAGGGGGGGGKSADTSRASSRGRSGSVADAENAPGRDDKPGAAASAATAGGAGAAAAVTMPEPAAGGRARVAALLASASSASAAAAAAGPASATAVLGGGSAIAEAAFVVPSVMELAAQIYAQNAANRPPGDAEPRNARELYEGWSDDTVRTGLLGLSERQLLRRLCVGRAEPVQDKLLRLYRAFQHVAAGGAAGDFAPGSPQLDRLAPEGPGVQRRFAALDGDGARTVLRCMGRPEAAARDEMALRRWAAMLGAGDVEAAPAATGSPAVAAAAAADAALVASVAAEAAATAAAAASAAAAAAAEKGAPAAATGADDSAATAAADGKVADESTSSSDGKAPEAGASAGGAGNAPAAAAHQRQAAPACRARGQSSASMEPMWPALPRAISPPPSPASRRTPNSFQ